MNPAFTRQIVGFSDAESDALIDELSMHIIKPETVYRHQWRAGDVVMWDNKTTQHCAVNDYGGDSSRNAPISGVRRSGCDGDPMTVFWDIP